MKTDEPTDPKTESSKMTLDQRYARMTVAIYFAGVIVTLAGVGVAGVGIYANYAASKRTQDLQLQIEANRFSTEAAIRNDNIARDIKTREDDIDRATIALKQSALDRLHTAMIEFENVYENETDATCVHVYRSAVSEICVEFEIPDIFEKIDITNRMLEVSSARIRSKTALKRVYQAMDYCYTIFKLESQVPEARGETPIISIERYVTKLKGSMRSVIVPMAKDIAAGKKPKGTLALSMGHALGRKMFDDIISDRADLIRAIEDPICNIDDLCITRLLKDLNIESKGTTESEDAGMSPAVSTNPHDPLKDKIITPVKGKSTK